jgi:trehalose 6-phosphate synthase/phosphatase
MIIPVTPTISNSAYGDPSSYFRTVRSPPDYMLGRLEAVSTSELNGAAEHLQQAVQAEVPISPADLAQGARSPEELLRRLSMADASSKAAGTAKVVDPRTTHPSLNLSGNVISAAFCVPFKVHACPDGEWELDARHGTSALFESLSYLSSQESPWVHTLVGWTGEIVKSAKKKPSPVVCQENGGGAFEQIPEQTLNTSIYQDAKHSSSYESGLQVTSASRAQLAKDLTAAHGGKVTPVWLPDEVTDNEVAILRDQARWRRYGEHELFTLFHYKQNEPTDGRAVRKQWTDYHYMNKAFTDAIVDAYKPGDIILIHDYQLLLVPSLIRQRLPNAYIGFFLHIPFPSSEYYRCLPRRKEIMEGVLGANMIGFQSYSYARHFSSCCSRILGFESSAAGVDAYGAHVPVDVFPIGINVDDTMQAAFGTPGIEQKMGILRDVYAGKKIIVGRDRLDSIRGVAQKLQAFEIFLTRYPQWQDKVVLIQVTSPTSLEEHGDKNDKMANKISELVARINGKFGSLSFTPVHHYPQYLSQEEYFALLRVADLGLITSVRDGMNTTALEYVLCQRDNFSPLIISEFSGTAGSLNDAIHINPWDLGGTADAINLALVMPDEEKQQKHERLYKHVTTNTVQAWTDSYLKRLLTNLASHDQAIATPVLDRAKMLSRYRNSSRRLFMFDYDGTLTPIVRDPQAAIPSDRVIRTLKSLASDPRNQVWIISGRDQAFLDEWMGHISELGLSAEHGSFMRMPNSSAWENLTATLDMSWQDEVLRIYEFYTARTPGSFVERKKIALTLHYRRADPEYGVYMARQCQKHLENTVVKQWDVEVMTGKANLEVRPRFVNKGEIAKRLVAEYGEGHGKAPDFVLCLGDDFTDEGKSAKSLNEESSCFDGTPETDIHFLLSFRADMFRTLRHSQLPEDHRYAVTVGAKTKQTLASWHLLEPADVISAIALLNGNKEGSNAAVAAQVDAEMQQQQQR